jgi:predicted outer membrane repeat protein
MLADARFINNTAAQGGAVNAKDCSLRATGCTFTGNRGEGGGEGEQGRGGAAALASTYFVSEKCRFMSNDAAECAPASRFPCAATVVP